MAAKQVQQFRAELECISAVLLNKNAGFSALYAASNDLFNLLCHASNSIAAVSKATALPLA